MSMLRRLMGFFRIGIYIDQCVKLVGLNLNNVKCFVIPFFTSLLL